MIRLRELYTPHLYASICREHRADSQLQPRLDESGRFSTSNGQFMNMNNGVPVVPPAPTTVPVITNVKFKTPSSPDHDLVRKRKLGFLPLEDDTQVLCKWRDNKFHPVKIIERRKMPNGTTNNYEYYVHYTEFNRRLNEWVKLENLELDFVETDVDAKIDDKAGS